MDVYCIIIDKCMNCYKNKCNALNVISNYPYYFFSCGTTIEVGTEELRRYYFYLITIYVYVIITLNN